MAWNFQLAKGSWVIDQNMQNFVLTNNSKATWPTKILMSFSNLSDNLLQDAYIIFKNSVDNFDIAHKTYSILVWGVVPP